jgi:hypothetical protein
LALDQAGQHVHLRVTGLRAALRHQAAQGGQEVPHCGVPACQHVG